MLFNEEWSRPVPPWMYCILYGCSLCLCIWDATNYQVPTTSEPLTKRRRFYLHGRVKAECSWRVAASLSSRAVIRLSLVDAFVHPKWRTLGFDFSFLGGNSPKETGQSQPSDSPSSSSLSLSPPPKPSHPWIWLTWRWCAMPRIKAPV